MPVCTAYNNINLCMYVYVRVLKITMCFCCTQIFKDCIFMRCFPVTFCCDCGSIFTAVFFNVISYNGIVQRYLFNLNIFFKHLALVTAAVVPDMSSCGIAYSVSLAPLIPAWVMCF